MKFLFALLMLAFFLTGVGCAPAVRVGAFPQVVGSSNQASTNTVAGVLNVKPQAPVVNDKANSIPIFVTGGHPPYTFAVLTQNGGYFSENLFTSTTVTGPIQATVIDSKGKVLLFTIQVIPTN